MAFTFVKTNSVIGTGTSMSVAFPTGGNTAGNFLVYITANYSSAAVTLTDTLNTPVQEFRYQGTQNTNQTIEVWTVRNCAGGANTVMQSGAGSHMRGLVVLEYSGDVAAGLHATSTGTGITTTPTTGTITPTVDGCLIVGGIIGSSAGTPYTPDVEYTEQADINGGGMGMHVQAFVQALAAAISSSPTPAAQIEYASVIVAFAPAPTTWVQVAYRWREDDGDEAAATALAAENTPITRPIGVNTRLRTVLNPTLVEPLGVQIRRDWNRPLADSVWRPLEVNGGGAVAYGAQGANTTTGTTAPTVAYPTGITMGQLLIMLVANRPNANTPATPAGWTLPPNGSATGGAGAEGVGTGTIRGTVFLREATGTETGTVTLALTGGTSVGATILRYTKTTGRTWDVALVNGADSTAGTSYSATAGADPGVTAGDIMVVASMTCAPTTGTPGVASELVTQTGVTFGTMVERVDQQVTTGNDLHLAVSEHPVTSGTGSAAPVYTMTASGTNAANTAGITHFIRIRQVLAPMVLSDSANISAGGATNTTAQLTSPGGSLGGGKISDDTNPFPSVDLTLGTYGEWETCLQATATAQLGEVYRFRDTLNGVALTTYTQTPEWTIGTPAAGGGIVRQMLQHGMSVSGGGGRPKGAQWLDKFLVAPSM